MKIMKRLCLVYFIFLLFTPEVFAKDISTKDEADIFLHRYCIELVKSIKGAYESQLKAVKKEDWKSFNKKGQWILGLSDVYSKLCK